ncbi:MAG TPA: SpoIIE family protein phosphatase [Thermoanaerobaculia bacterium]|jgi:serine phosphatase RsbU (regulator of sigma subunit)
MKLRAQLILFILLLAVLPLTGIVLYSYHSSRRALETAYKQEADRLSRQMDRRLTAIRSDLDDRLTQASNTGIDVSDTDPVIGNIMNAIGDAAPLVDALEFHPVAPPEPPAARVDVAALAAPSPKATPAPPEPSEAPEPPDAEHHASIAREVRIHPPVAGGRYTIVTPELREGIVIDLPRVPQFEIPPEEAAKLAEIGRLSRLLGTNADQLSPAEHEKLKNDLRRLQREVDVKMDLARGEFEREMAEFTRKQQTAMNAQIQRLHVRARERAAQNKLDGTLIGGGGAPAKIAAVAPVTSVGTSPAAKPTAAALAAKAAPKPEIKLTRDLTPAEKLKLQTAARRTALILGRKLNVPVTKNGAVVGQITAQVRPEEVIRRVLGNPGDDGEIAFAIDREGNLYTRNAQERSTLDRLGIPKKTRDIPGWIVAMTADEESGMRVGVARPVGENLQELRRTAARNFTWGLGLVFVAIIGVVPFTNHLTRDVQVISDGAERIAHGDLMTRLPVKSKNEIGQLAVAFNRMAEDLSLQQQRLVAQERARKEQEMQQRLLALEYDRKTVELEEARRFQLSMLPKELPKHPTLDVAVFTQTATEVGGDYYDFHVIDGGALSITIGDATGHGAKAGTMVTVVKTLFAGYSPDVAPSHFLRDAAEKIKRMELGRMSMALSLGRFDGHHLTVASAGMPPVLVRRAAGTVEEFSIGATPLGTLGADYRDQTLDVFPGDTVLFLTDGFPELFNAAGTQLGYAATQDLFAEAAAGAKDAAGVIEKLAEAARQWHGEQPPNDDVTFVVVRVA